MHASLDLQLGAQIHKSLGLLLLAVAEAVTAGAAVLPTGFSFLSPSPMSECQILLLQPLYKNL